MLCSLSYLLLVFIPLLDYIVPVSFAAPLQVGPSPGPLLIDIFDDPRVNALGQYHGGSGLGQFQDGEEKLIITTNDVDGRSQTSSMIS
jgi:hypothetical protein